MIIVKTVKEFVKQNEKHLIRFLQYKTGINDREMIDDTLQEFYMRLYQTKALESYDEKRGTFDTYIGNLFCWMLPFLSRKNFKYRHTLMPKRYRDKYLDKNEKGISNNHMYDYRMMSYVNKDNSKMWVDGDDVFNYVHENSATFKISKAYETSYFDTDEDPALSGYLESFKTYIRETESPRSAEKMILFLEQRVAGCKGVEIAGMMKVSNNMVKIIKHTLKRKYDTWQTIDA